MKSLIQIWMQPIYARLNMDSRRALYWLLAIFPILSGLFGIVLYFAVPEKRFSMLMGSLVFGFASALTIFVLFWFGTFAQHLALQSSPENASLVPNFKSRLMWAFLIPVVGLAVLVESGVYFYTGRFTLYPALLVVVVICGLTALFRLNGGFILFNLVVVFPVLFSSFEIDQHYASLIKQLGAYAWLVNVILIALCLAIFVWWFFGVRGEKHFRVYKNALNSRRVFSGERLNENLFEPGIDRVFLWWMRRTTASIMPTRTRLDEQDRSSLITHVFGPRMHWSTACVQVLWACVQVCAFLLLLSLFRGGTIEGFFAQFEWGYIAALFIVLPVIYYFGAMNAIQKTKTEQALLCLSPHAGDWQIKNQTLANYLMSQYVILCGLSALTVLALIPFFTDSPNALPLMLLGLVAVFRMALGLFRQHSKAQSINAYPLLRQSFFSAVVFVAGAAILYSGSAIAAFIYGLSVLIVTVFLLRSFYLLFIEVPQFPAGRAVN